MASLCARRRILLAGLIAFLPVACGGPTEQSSLQPLTAPSAASTAEVRVEGRIDAISMSAAQVSVGGRVISITGATEIREDVARRGVLDLRSAIRSKSAV